MLFRKKMPKACRYCAHSAVCDEEMILCKKRGIVAPDGKCRKFRYDPIKRIPAKSKALDFDKYSNEDFSL